MRLRVVGGLLILGASAGAAAFAVPPGLATAPGALPKEVRPIEHVVHLVPDVAARRFEGRQTVRLNVLAPTRRLTMHGRELEVDAATLAGPGFGRAALAAPRVDRERDLLVFDLPRRLPKGRFRLDMRWHGRINDTVEGLYAERYREGGDDRVLLATDLEPTGARRILPCWDEPAFRTRFRLSVDLPPGWQATSNMPPLRRRALAGGGTRVDFAPTPPMASYLLALVAGDTERVETVAAGTRLGIVAVRGRLAGAAEALDATRQLLDYYGGYFGQRYPLPKLDQIAVPDGSSGGMENWGAVVYTESRLLVDPATSSERQRKRAYWLVAHELAHQWFGDLVTMAWWDDLWLNEAFAEWMSQKAIDRFHPEWRVPLDAAASREGALDLDARATTHPIRQPIAVDAEAAGAFDAITYDKGAAVLRMIEAWLGEDAFRGGLRLYMARHRGGNTTDADLWAALAEASRRPVVAELANGWTRRPGFPLIDVDAGCERGMRRVTLAQSPFAGEPGAGSGATLWRVPVHLQSGDRRSQALLAGRVATVEQAGCDGALVVDPDHVGYFRVRYAPALFAALVAGFARLPDAARLRLLTDTSALVRSGLVPIDDWLALLPALRDEPRRTIWTQLTSDLASWDDLLAGDAAQAGWRRLAVAAIRPRLDRLGWDAVPGETEEDAELRGRLVASLVRFDDATALAETRRRFDRWRSDRPAMSPPLLDAVLAGAGRGADAATWEALHALALASRGEEQERYLGALAAVRDPSLLQRTLALSISNELPRSARRAIVPTVARSGQADAAWAFAAAHAAAVTATAPSDDAGRMLAGIAAASATPRVADELETLVAATLPPVAAVDARRAADEIRGRARLKARMQRDLERVVAPP